MWLFSGLGARATAAAPASWHGAGSLKPSLLQLSIPETHTARPLDNSSPFAVFDIRVQYEVRAWSVHHRFSEFKVLAQVLQERYAHRVQVPLLPGESILSALDEVELVQQRRAALETYLLRLVQVVPLDDDCLSAFLGLEILCLADSQPEPEPALAGTDVAGAVSEPRPATAMLPGEALEPVAELGSPARPSAEVPASALRPDAARKPCSSSQGEPVTPFSWELVWEGPIGALDYDWRVRS